MNEADAYRTGHNIIQLANSLTRLANQKMRDTGLTASQSEAMRYILKHSDEQLTAVELMEQLDLSQSTVAGLIKRLEAKQLICRHTDEQDARRSLIMPTKHGQALHSALRRIAAHTEHELLQGMTDVEIREFNRLLELAQANISRMRYKGGAEDE